MDYEQTYLVIQRRHKKETPEETIEAGIQIYNAVLGYPPTLLAMSLNTVYTTSSPELTVVQDRLIAEGVYYFGQASGEPTDGGTIYQ